MKQILNILTGETFPAYVNPEGTRFWLQRELKQNGQPDKRNRGSYLGVRKLGYYSTRPESEAQPHHFTGHFVLAPIFPANDDLGNAHRRTIKAIQDELDRARVAMFAHYCTAETVQTIS